MRGLNICEIENQNSLHLRIDWTPWNKMTPFVILSLVASAFAAPQVRKQLNMVIGSILVAIH